MMRVVFVGINIEKRRVPKKLRKRFGLGWRACNVASRVAPISAGECFAETEMFENSMNVSPCSLLNVIALYVHNVKSPLKVIVISISLAFFE